jgi:parvulin-like peptidyl-prolyl isomerase
MKYQPLPSLAVGILLFASSTLQADNSVVAKVGSREIKASEIQPYLDALTAPERSALLADKAELGRFVRGILVRQAVLQDATAAGWDKKPETIAAISRVRDQYLVESYLVEIGKVPADYPSDDEVKRVYEAEKDRLQMPKRYELSQIFIAADDDKSAAQKRAADLAAKAKSRPADFGSLAKANSNDAASAARDGQLGWLAEESIAPEIRKAVAGLSKGQITAPVEGRAGYHVIKVDDVREAGIAPFDEVKGELTNLLRNRRMASNRESHVASLLDRQPVSVNELALEVFQSNASR